MKRTFLTVVFGIMMVLCYGQTISVADFHLDQNDMTAMQQGTSLTDQNGERCALIKIETTQNGFTFDVGSLGIVKQERHGGDIWLYVPYGIRKMTIGHPQLGTLRNYPIPCNIEKGRTYIMKLVTGEVQTTVTNMISSQYLVFNVTPKDAMVEVNGEIWNNIEGTARKFVPFGEYRYSIQTRDYHTVSDAVLVNNPNEKVVVNVSLLPAFGSIIVPERGNLSGATVYIDNKIMGKVPLTANHISSGNHNVRIAKAMYKSYEQSVIVSDGQTTTVSPSLTSNFSSVILNVDNNAEIWINDEKKGYGEWRGDLECGDYRIETRKEGHHSQSKVYTINASSEIQTIKLSAPIPIYGSLNIVALPDGSSVSLDGKNVGETPLFLQQVLIGPHNLKLSKSGYAPTERTITITENKMEEVAIELVKGIAKQTFTVNGVSFTMLPVEGGTFMMGATPEMENPYYNEKPVHEVTVSNFAIGQTEVTQALWKAVMGNNPSYFKGDNLPVEQVSWKDCQEFIEKLNALTGKTFRLPTEAEWEFAARGGNKSNHYQYSGSSNIDAVAWYTSNSGIKTHPVATKQPNELGIYDMTGNVLEWCSDWHGSYSSSSQTNPTGPTSGSGRVYRGGGWYGNARNCRSSDRYGSTPVYSNNNLGLRLVYSE